MADAACHQLLRVQENGPASDYWCLPFLHQGFIEKRDVHMMGGRGVTLYIVVPLRSVTISTTRRTGRTGMP
ncbi:MAG: hypothetical protein C4576_31935 [Desulfobacteraceae bacterium]|nr:MAG: hypothetical protein C4576_31935 [Desulfobacteraceae bacterium]